MLSLKSYLRENGDELLISFNKSKLNESGDIRFKTLSNHQITFQFSMQLKLDTLIIELIPKTHIDLDLMNEMEEKDTLDIFIKGIENTLSKKLKMHCSSRTSHDSSILKFEVMKHVLADYIYNVIK